MFLDYLTVAVFVLAPTVLGLRGIAAGLSYTLAVAHLLVTLATDLDLGVSICFRPTGTVGSGLWFARAPGRPLDPRLWRRSHGAIVFRRWGSGHLPGVGAYAYRAAGEQQVAGSAGQLPGRRWGGC
jgi:hypothetical protein